MRESLTEQAHQEHGVQNGFHPAGSKHSSEFIHEFQSAIARKEAELTKAPSRDWRLSKLAKAALPTTSRSSWPVPAAVDDYVDKCLSREGRF
jgi:hypothetical protein